MAALEATWVRIINPARAQLGLPAIESPTTNYVSNVIENDPEDSLMVSLNDGSLADLFDESS